MADWHPASESPEPHPWFVRELRRIDPEMRVVWAMERYLRAEWAIERKIEPERYFAMHSSLLSDDGDRFIDQPVFDDSKPLYDEFGDLTGYEQIGTRKLDLAPEWEHIAFRPTLDQALLTKIKQLIWENNHQEEVLRQQALDDEARLAEKKMKRIDAATEGIDEAMLEVRTKVQFGHGAKRNET